MRGYFVQHTNDEMDLAITALLSRDDGLVGAVYGFLNIQTMKIDFVRSAVLELVLIKAQDIIEEHKHLVVL